MEGQKILRRPAVLEMIGVSVPTLYRWMDKGLFPRPVRLGPQAVGWRSADVDEWLSSREFSSGGRPA